MENKNHLTKTELEIYTTIKEIKDIITTKEIQDVYPEYTKNKVNIILKNLVDKKYLLRLNKSKYIINKEYLLEEIQKIAINFNYGYISYSTALYNYKLIDYIPETIFITTKNKSKEIIINKKIIKYIHTKQFNNYIKKEEILISTLEKTIIDCFYKIEYAGGYSTLTKAIYHAQDQLDWNKFINIYKTIKSKRQKQITGYILELLKNNTDFKIPSKIINFFKNQEKSKTYLINTKNKKSKYLKDWKIKDNYGKKNILSWWN
jgi:predicted transcriptional regulator of viral defense system